jgi:cytochrome c biogenesis protein CcdA
LPFQYHFLTRPFRTVKERLAARLGTRWTPGVRAKLFAFGAGYGAAGFACVAPPFIGAVLNASVVGRPQDAAFGLLLYVVIVIALMTGVTVALQLAGTRALEKIKVWSGVIKYVSAVALSLAGVYLLLLFSKSF